jgi:hypothetical protein
MKSVLPRFPKIDKRLLGTWKSDRKRTFAEWNWRTGISPEKKEELKSIFGKLLITYTRSRVIWNLPYRKWVTARRYATLGADETSVAIVIFGKRHVKNAQKYDRINLEIVNEFWSELKIQQIHFTGNHYWISIGGGKNREFFRKIRRGKYTNSR